MSNEVAAVRAEDPALVGFLRAIVEVVLNADDAEPMSSKDFVDAVALRASELVECVDCPVSPGEVLGLCELLGFIEKEAWFQANHGSYWRLVRTADNETADEDAD